MSNKNLSIREWIKAYNEGEFDAKDLDTQVKAGWYDWFCNDKSLAGKTRRLSGSVKRIARSKKVDIDKMYVWFKNNCPMNGSLYDDFRFADIETGDVIFTIIPRSGHNALEGRSEVWGKENGFKEPLVTGTWKDVIAFFFPEQK